MEVSHLFLHFLGGIQEILKTVGRIAGVPADILSTSISQMHFY